MKKPYSGILAEQFPADQKFGPHHFLERIVELAKHYEIDVSGKQSDGTNSWMELAFRLAEDHVPGFQRKKTAGAGKKWLPPDMWILVSQVMEMKGRGVGINNACIILAKRNEYKERGLSADALRSQFYRTVKGRDSKVFFLFDLLLRTEDPELRSELVDWMKAADPNILPGNSIHDQPPAAFQMSEKMTKYITQQLGSVEFSNDDDE